MKSIFAAIGTALRATFALLRALISIPGRLFAGLLGGSIEAPPEPGSSELVRSLRAELEETGDRTRRNAEKIAAIVAAWCADSMLAGRPLPAPTPPRVSRGVANWLPGLSREECAEIVCAGKEAVCEHIAGVCAIRGVRPVQRLEALSTWPSAAPVVAEPPGFLSISMGLQDAR
ncbi:hypothetical protein SAMN05216338_1001872 [Bradyrhizobium sp. Rc2d]|uniref:hypothetical protein n=1 Tax=Bradyrhizobium sp. Rc2d TaxID=1855321 RepID=UPI0008824D10|nr:hypothetical protein [Bradyrhizobium sp. Rc2d]SDG60225.1 hypothetical protein SAMN05216338_1001872 [Bradyrhizobium sp. Rc2d]